jgi:release factor glutamine methyltransferase
VVATDVSSEALDVARLNRERLDMHDRVELRQADLVDGVEGPFDLVLANLPYIDPDWPDAVTAEVAGSEPGQALYGGRDGLELIARLLPELPRLAPAGVAMLEFDPRQRDALLERAAAIGRTSVRNDLAGLPRVLVVEL